MNKLQTISSLQITYSTTLGLMANQHDVIVTGLTWPGLKGQLSTQNRPASFGASIDGTYEMGDGTIVDMSNRNIHYGNNVMVWSQELVDFMTIWLITLGVGT